MAKTGTFATDRKCEILGIIVLGLTALLFLALITDGFVSDRGDRRLLDGMTQVPNLLGVPGAVTAGILAIIFGDAAHAIYALTFIWGLMLLSHRPLDRFVTRFAGLFVVTAAVAGLLQMDLISGVSNPQAGGAFGSFMADRLLVRYFGHIGSNVVGVTLLAIGILLATDFLFVHVLLVLRKSVLYLILGSYTMYEGLVSLLRGRRRFWKRRVRKPALREAMQDLEPVLHLNTYPGNELGDERVESPHLPWDVPATPPVVQELPFDETPEVNEEVHEVTAADGEIQHPDNPPDDLNVKIAEPLPAAGQLELAGLASSEFSRRKPRRARRKAETVELPPDYQYPKRYTPPTLDLLDLPEPRIVTNLNEQLRATSRVLEETLQTFGIEARVTDVTRGPTITRFELEPAPGIKVSRFLALADDIALALKAHRVRVEAPIPGKGRVGIEVPNVDRDQVLIRELLESRAFAKGKGKIKLALGKDIAGEVKIADLAAMPHLLVAGATGAGKTVCVKALLASLLFQHSPDELQLMLIDPKMVELSIFNDIPHLITPVVTEPKKAATSLNWLINEMEERYRLFADLRVRNIEVYNESVENGEIEMEPGEGETDGQSFHVVRKLPYIVCIIDELADLMMLARAEVEDAIARLAQLARAVGIHLIIATQRPSVDVLTGVIKANFPARMSFQVSSRVDSRCILDEIGAERLIGMGDMLYLPAGQSKPHRIQGAFVSDDEMNSLVAYLKTQAPPQYRDEIENFGKNSESLAELVDESDPLFDEAVQVVLETGQASISMVQRRLRVGYTRAARLIDMMELKGIVGPHTGSKAREILVDSPPRDEVA